MLPCTVLKQQRFNDPPTADYCCVFMPLQLLSLTTVWPVVMYVSYVLTYLSMARRVLAIGVSQY